MGGVSRPYPYYSEPAETREVEALLTITHEDGTTTLHPVYVELEGEDDDLISALCEDRYGSPTDEAWEDLKAARVTEIDARLDYWDDVEDEWPGASPFAA